jgi:hypothetical protein
MRLNRIATPSGGIRTTAGRSDYLQPMTFPTPAVAAAQFSARAMRRR